VVQTISKDQGWSSYPDDRGTHNNSWTWFELTLERAQETADEWMEIHRRKLWSNIHASREMISHVIDLGCDEEIVRDAKKGDRVCIWACAKFPRWTNEVEQVGTWIFTAVH
jgi:hypothetical protein